MKIVNAATMQALDQRTIQELGLPALVLMERAALGISASLLQHFPHQLQAVQILAGPGNNGGDGLAIARLLHCQGLPVKVWLQGNLAQSSPEHQLQLAINQRLGIEMGPVVLSELAAALPQASLIVDALLGVGLSRPVRGDWAEVIHLANAAAAPKVAVDLPSGLQADTGQVLGAAICANLTVSCALPKWAHYLDPALDQIGRLEIVDIGIPPSLFAGHPEYLISPERLRACLPATRRRNSHKGSYGRLGIVAGAQGMSGAAQMAATAALQTGVGLVFLYVPASLQPSLAVMLPEVQVRPLPEQQGQVAVAALPELLESLKNMDAVLIGPGLGRHPDPGLVLKELCEHQCQPMVLDADALFHLGTFPQVFPQPTILTPHPGELGRLLERSSAEIQADRVLAVRQAAERFQAVTVLKGACSLVASPAGELAFNPSGNPGMARGGMGDVLAGLCGGLLAQGLEAQQAAELATGWHGLAGDLARQDLPEAALTVQSLLKYLPQAWAQLH